MAPHNQYGNYYDPVGSHANQPHGYTYRTPNTSSAQYPSVGTSAYQSSAYQNHNNSYGIEQYGATSQETRSAGKIHRAAAAVPSTFGTQSYSQLQSGQRQPSISHNHDQSAGSERTNQMQEAYGSTLAHSASSQPPMYGTNNPVPSPGRFVPHHSSTANANTYGDSQRLQQAAVMPNAVSYTSHDTNARDGYAQRAVPPPPPPPPRYSSPLHAIRAQQGQQGYRPQSSHSSNFHAVPQMAQNGVQQGETYQRQHSASVESSPVTVNPSQVYDLQAEQNRKAEKEAERRKRVEAEVAARRAETERAEEARRKADKAAREAVETSRQKAEEDERARKAAEAAAKKKAVQEQRKEQQQGARQEKQRTSNAASASPQPTSGNIGGDVAVSDEEHQMREMFKRMREFNQRNPAMLAKLWEEERQAHSVSVQSQRDQAPDAPTASSLVNGAVPKPPTQPPARPSVPPANDTAVAATAPVRARTQSNTEQQGRQSSSHETLASTTAVTALTTQPKPINVPSQQASNTLWPPQKKGTIADIAATWLNNLPINRARGRMIWREDVLKVLDTNPTYQKLCEAIESLGIVFERSALARELLRAVPDELKPQNGVKAAISSPAAATAKPAHVNDSPAVGAFTIATEPKRDAAKSVPPSANPTVTYQSPSFPPMSHTAASMASVRPYSVPAHVNANADRASAQSQPPDLLRNPHVVNGTANDGQAAIVLHRPVIKPEVDMPPVNETTREPADKEEAARKRTFSDLVDLTHEDSDDDMPPSKMLHFSTMLQPGPVKDLRLQQSFHQPPMLFQPYRHNGLQHIPPPGFLPGQPPLPAAPTQSMPSAPASPAPPPAVPVPPKPRGPSAEQLQKERIRGKMLVEPLMRDRVARKSTYDSRTIARDVLLATGRHPDMRALNAHLNPMDKLLSTRGGLADGHSNKCDLSTIRWDIIDPSGPQQANSLPHHPAQDDDRIEDADDEGEAYKGKRTPKPEAQRHQPDVDAASVPLHAQNGKSAEQHKRRGRPPKFTSPSHHMSASSVGEKHLTPSVRTLKVQRAVQSSPMASTPSAAVGYAAFRQVDEHGNVIKKKGRPVGWRKNIHSREAHGMAPANDHHKPRAAPQLKQDVKMQAPHYQVYRCRWKGCPSELHSLDVLKKHIVKVHGQADRDGTYTCAWRGCTAAHAHANSPDQQPPGAAAADDTVATFDNIQDWMRHTDKQHLQDIAWELGDGPRGGSLSDRRATMHSDSEVSYLSDAHGRSVTPIISPDTPKSAEQRSSVWLDGRPPKAGLSREELHAVAELKRLEGAKRAEGPVMGTEGTRLANAKRRLGFLDDEDFADEVESSELGET